MFVDEYVSHLNPQIRSDSKNLVPVMNQISHPQIYPFYEPVIFSLIMILLIQANKTNSRITLYLETYVHYAHWMKYENERNYFLHSCILCNLLLLCLQTGNPQVNHSLAVKEYSRSSADQVSNRYTTM